MKRATEIALRKSIKKWEAIVAGTGEDCGSKNCALCKRFFYRGEFGCTRDDGEVCPVREASGAPICINTPYETFIEYAEEAEGSFPRKIMDNESAIAAVLELEFLKSLLPRKK